MTPTAPDTPRDEATASTPAKKSGFSVKRLWPLALVAAGIGAFFALGLDRYVSFQALSEHRAALLDLVETYGVLAAIAYMVVYAVVVAFSLPGGAVLTVTGGFLFGLVWGSLYVVIGATLGATAVFLIARYALGEQLRAKAGPWIKRMEAGFREDAVSYMLVLRLVPIFPFWLVNLVPAFLGVSTRAYVLTTFFGIMPGSIVFASIGNGLGEIFDRGETPDLSIITDPAILGPILGLAALAMIPVVYKRIKRARGGAAMPAPELAEEAKDASPEAGR